MPFMRYQFLSILTFACTWLAVSFSVSTLGDLLVGGKEMLNVWGVARNFYFAALECPISTAFFALSLALVWAVCRQQADTQGLLRRFRITGIVVGLIEATLLFLPAQYAWSGHDNETAQAVGPYRFVIGVTFEMLSGLIGCLAGASASAAIFIRLINKSLRLAWTIAAIIVGIFVSFFAYANHLAFYSQ